MDQGERRGHARRQLHAARRKRDRARIPARRGPAEVPGGDGGDRAVSGGGKAVHERGPVVEHRGVAPREGGAA